MKSIHQVSAFFGTKGADDMKKLDVFGYYGVVYMIINLCNDKRYIGITTRTIEERFEEHCKADSYIGRAIRKYGRENFFISIIDTADDKEELFELERKYIKLYETFKNGYNLTIGGDGVSLVEDLEVCLTKKQKSFCEKVEKENKLDIDVNNANEMIRMIAFNIVYLYLTCTKARDKIQVAKLYLKMSDSIKDFFTKTNILDIEEVNHYASQKLSSFERWCGNG